MKYSKSTILDRWGNWLECCSMNQMVVGFIPGHSTYLCGGFNPWSVVYRRQLISVSHIDVSLYLISPLSKINKNISLGEDQYDLM